MTERASTKYNPNLKGGSRKGIQNKQTRELKEMVFGALEANGGQKYLEEQAIMNPGAFMTLLGKFVPKDVNVGGQYENPVKTIIEYLVVNPKDTDTSTG